MYSTGTEALRSRKFVEDKNAVKDTGLVHDVNQSIARSLKHKNRVKNVGKHSPPSQKTTIFQWNYMPYQNRT